MAAAFDALRHGPLPSALTTGLDEGRAGTQDEEPIDPSEPALGPVANAPDPVANKLPPVANPEVAPVANKLPPVANPEVAPVANKLPPVANDDDSDLSDLAGFVAKRSVGQRATGWRIERNSDGLYRWRWQVKTASGDPVTYQNASGRTAYKRGSKYMPVERAKQEIGK